MRGGKGEKTSRGDECARFLAMPIQHVAVAASACERCSVCAGGWCSIPPRRDARCVCSCVCVCVFCGRAGVCACVHVCMCRVAMQMGDTINQVLFYQGEGSQETSESDTFRSPATLYSPPTPPIKSPPTDLPCYLVLSGSSGSLRRAHARSCGRRVWSGNASGHKSQLEASYWSTVACLKR